MDSGLISFRYANALLEYAAGQHQEEEVYERMKLLSGVYFRMQELRRVLMNPSVLRKDKQAILLTACGGNVPSSLSGMIDLILKNEREEAILSIAQRFIDLYRDKFQIRSGRLVTAAAIDEATTQQLIARIRKIVGMKIEMETTVDPEILGGFVLSIGDYRWDASVAGELNRIRKKFKKHG